VWWRWWTAPAWWRVLEFTVVFGVIFTVVAGVEDGGTDLPLLVTGLIAGVVVALFYGPQTAGTRERLVRSLPAGTTPAQVRAALRASRRGPVPEDPVVRVVTTVLLRQRVAGALASQRQSVVVGAVGVVVSGVLAVTAHPAFAVLGAVFLWGFVETFWRPRRLVARLVALEGD
jgi:hypothetical protein